jgi:hypothetical protein
MHRGNPTWHDSCFNYAEEYLSMNEDELVKCPKTTYILRFCHSGAGRNPEVEKTVPRLPDRTPAQEAPPG